MSPPTSTKIELSLSLPELEALRAFLHTDDAPGNLIMQVRLKIEEIEKRLEANRKIQAKFGRHE